MVASQADVQNAVTRETESTKKENYTPELLPLFGL